MLFIKTTYTGAVAAIAKDFGSREDMMRECMKGAYEDTLDFWHKKIRPRHFEREAMSVYGYTPRTIKYEKKKSKKAGHRRPLVFSGESQQATERNYIRVSGVSGSLHMNAGNLGWPTPGGRINMRRELISTTPQDEAAMAKVAEESIVRRVRKWYAVWWESLG